MHKLLSLFIPDILELSDQELFDQIQVDFSDYSDQSDDSEDPFEEYTCIGTGQSAMLYAVRDDSLALKTIEMTCNEDWRQIRREITFQTYVARKLGVAPHVHSVLLNQNYCCILMDRVHGETLAKKTEDDQWLKQPVSDKLNLLLHMSKSVQRMHSLSIYHCDLESSNIMIPSEGSPVIIDFGLADNSTRSVESDLKLFGRTILDTFLGTNSSCTGDQSTYLDTLDSNQFIETVQNALKYHSPNLSKTIIEGISSLTHDLIRDDLRTSAITFSDIVTRLETLL